ncbi:hypothetical protein [Lentibacillus sp.]|uniref:hypothetical protein n=1 Tax=Lentibacillus sp. TaxID=1925746 RepID=UPI002B4B86B6|nr:hypothetical protein [Lentibacillus sp.]HLS08764.1 hypothetical protein [Lentibacillus sp.]
MRKSIYLRLLGAIFAAGVVLGLVLYILTGEGGTTDENTEKEDLYKQETVQVLNETVEVLSVDDRMINTTNLLDRL